MSMWAKSAAVAVIALGSVFAVTGAAHAKKCVLAGGEGTGVTQDVATFMANAALKQSMQKLGVKPSGKAKVSCKTDLVITTCVAKQRGCK
ncbi:MAG: hypothetical protein RLZ98_115 [Pseudomonadota bacterium]|jgi:hypothetical protein